MTGMSHIDIAFQQYSTLSIVNNWLEKSDIKVRTLPHPLHGILWSFGSSELKLGDRTECVDLESMTVMTSADRSEFRRDIGRLTRCAFGASLSHQSCNARLPAAWISVDFMGTGI